MIILTKNEGNNTTSLDSTEGGARGTVRKNPIIF